MTTPTPAVYIDHRYQLEDELGQGGMGMVHKAMDRLTGQTVALKRLVLPLELLDFMSRTQSDDLRLSLTREFQLAASLRHPYIVTVYDYGFVDRQPYLTMEFLPQGRPLGQELYQYSLDQKLRWCQQLLQALVYLHRRGIIHRDLKPTNVLLVNDRGEDYVKVVDFGLSIIRGEAREIEGTLGYLAPEVLQGEAPTVSADLYAAGIIAYEVLGGRHPFYHPDPERMVEIMLQNEADVQSLGVAQPIAEVLQKLLATHPSDRYANAEQALTALTSAVGDPQQENWVVRESFLKAAQFVGREFELSTLQKALDQAAQSHGSCWLIAGESGIGKSRLLEEVRIRALVKGFTVLRGQAVEDAGLPFQLWREPIRRLLLSVTVSSLEASVLKPIVPDINQLTGTVVPDAPPLYGRAVLERLSLTIATVIRRYERPLVLILEDLHWSDEALEPLHMLNASAETHSLLILGSYRDDERPELSAKLPKTHLLKLERLQQTHIAELSTSMIGSSGESIEVSDLITRETEGNIFFIVEVVRALAEISGQMSEIGRVTLPERVFAGGIQQVVLRRLKRVPEADLALLKFAAVAGRYLDLKVLKTVQHRNVEPWLNTCLNAAVLDIQDERWRFAHDKLRETLLQDLTGTEHRTLHYQVAEALEQTYENDPAYAASIAEHWRQAENRNKERHYATIAGQYGLQIANPNLAVRMFKRVLELTELVTDQVAVYKGLGDAHLHLGKYPEAADYYQQSRALLNQEENISALAAAVHGLGVVYRRQGQFEQANTYLEQSRIMYEQLNDQRGVAASFNELGAAAGLSGNLQLAQAFHEKSLAIYMALADQTGIANSYNSLAIDHYFQSRYDLAAENYQRSLEMAEAIGDRRMVANILNNLGTLALDEGNFEQAQTYHGQSFRIREQIADQDGMGRNQLMLGRIATALGKYGEAQEYHQRSITILQEVGNQILLADNYFSLGNAARYVGELDKAQEFTQRSLTMYQSIGSKLGLANNLQSLGEIALARQQYTEARGYFQQSIGLYQEAEHQASQATGLARLALNEHYEGSDDQSVKHFLEALILAQTVPTLNVKLSVLTDIARFLHHQNNYPQLVLQLVAVLREHPLLTFDQKNTINRLQDSLPQMSENTQTTLETVVGEVLVVLRR
jgi:tetratricopeptide (TPR) repeat protein